MKKKIQKEHVFRCSTISLSITTYSWVSYRHILIESMLASGFTGWNGLIVLHVFSAFKNCIDIKLKEKRKNTIAICQNYIYMYLYIVSEHSFQIEITLKRNCLLAIYEKQFGEMQKYFIFEIP